MQTKKMSFWWSVPIGLVFPALQIAISFLRFNELDPYTPLLDYLWFYLAGVAGVLWLIFLFHRSKTGVQKWVVFLAFLLATPISTLAMANASGFGPIGILLFPFIIWALFSGFGFVVGWYFSRRLAQTG